MYFKEEFPIIFSILKEEQSVRVNKLKVSWHLDWSAIDILIEDWKNIFKCGSKMPWSP